MRSPKLSFDYFPITAEKKLVKKEALIFEEGKNEFNTERLILNYDRRKHKSSILKKIIEDLFGLKTASINDFSMTNFTESKIECIDALFYEDLGVILWGPKDCSLDENLKNKMKNFFSFKQEKVIFGINFFKENLHLVKDLPLIKKQGKNEKNWGIRRINANKTCLTGKNVKVAVLDTGFYKDHPSFLNREIFFSSFVQGEDPSDKKGHGTHCIGIACGNCDSDNVQYGVAKEAIIYSGKVISERGVAAEIWGINGIRWAIEQNCDVISMSFMYPNYTRHLFDRNIENQAKLARKKNIIIVAAAGNYSKPKSPVVSPANCPSILAIGALKKNNELLEDSAVGIYKNGGEINFVAPGEDIYSSWNESNQLYNLVDSGTSCSAAFAAGVLALLYEKFSSRWAWHTILKKLYKLCERIENLSTKEGGAGLVIAPKR